MRVSTDRRVIVIVDTRISPNIYDAHDITNNIVLESCVASGWTEAEILDKVRQLGYESAIIIRLNQVAKVFLALLKSHRISWDSVENFAGTVKEIALQ